MAEKNCVCYKGQILINCTMCGKGIASPSLVFRDMHDEVQMMCYDCSKDLQEYIDVRRKQLDRAEQERWDLPMDDIPMEGDQ